MLNLRVWTVSLGSWAVTSFTLCVLGGVLLPGLPIAHEALKLFLPGFTWISPGAFVLGLVESFLLGAYAGLVFVPIHNFFQRRWGMAPASSRTVNVG